MLLDLKMFFSFQMRMKISVFVPCVCVCVCERCFFAVNRFLQLYTRSYSSCSLLMARRVTHTPRQISLNAC